MLALTLLILAATYSFVLADHKICVWKPWKDSPEAHHFVLFCTGEKGATDPVEWKCGDGHIGKKGTLVADWNRLRWDILEIATPCGGNGYGRDHDGDCFAGVWAACRGPGHDGDCYYFQGTDDCEWPNELLSDELPWEINIYFHRGY